MNLHELETIAASLHVLRPDWPAAQLRTLIRDELMERPRRDVLVALAWVAADSNSHSPYRVLENGPWWKAAAVDRTTSTVAERVRPGLLCATCSQPEERCRATWADDHEYEPADQHRARVTSTPPDVAAKLDQIRSTASKTQRPRERQRRPRKQRGSQPKRGST